MKQLISGLTPDKKKIKTLHELCYKLIAVPDPRSEEVGFEPTKRLSRLHAFQACSIGHSDTPPYKESNSTFLE